ncbi:MAG: rhamnulokinase [Microbacteriaceae bacterium]|nr:rhamnulokinase [Microbacteriaceae bacterium]
MSTNTVDAIGAVAAVDLGVTSGSVTLGIVGPNELRLSEVARFSSAPVRIWDGDRAGLHWSAVELYRYVISGLAAALAVESGLASVGVTSLAGDYGLMRRGRLLGTPYYHRDERTSVGVAITHSLVEPEALYRENGLRVLPFSTLYQLTVDRIDGILAEAEAALLIPDLFTYWLSGERIAEVTNAVTTGLLGHDGGWNLRLMEQLAFPRRLFPSLVLPGTEIGGLLPSVLPEGIASSAAVTSVGSHDSASAIVAVPMQSETAAYISCGTWGQVGVELDRPVLTEASRLAKFTNERGVDGRIRFLRDVIGLWLLSECERTWNAQGFSTDLPTLLARAETLTAPPAVFDSNDPRFLPPGDMPRRIAGWYDDHGLPAPDSPEATVRAIVESLAVAFADAVQTAEDLSGHTVNVIHIVGGGSLNRLLCQLTADRIGITVLAGPIEATAIGNILVQARAHGFVSGDLETMRALVARAFPPTAYEPRQRGSAE